METLKRYLYKFVFLFWFKKSFPRERKTLTPAKQQKLINNQQFKSSNILLFFTLVCWEQTNDQGPIKVRAKRRWLNESKGKMEKLQLSNAHQIAADGLYCWTAGLAMASLPYFLLFIVHFCSTYLWTFQTSFLTFLTKQNRIGLS